MFRSNLSGQSTQSTSRCDPITISEFDFHLRLARSFFTRAAAEIKSFPAAWNLFCMRGNPTLRRWCPPPHTSFSPSILTSSHLFLPLPTHHAHLSWFNQKNSAVVTWGGRKGGRGSVKQAITHLQTKQNQENMFLSLNLNLCHLRPWQLTPPQNHDLVQQTFSSHPFLCHMIKSVSLISVFLTNSFSGAPEPWFWRIRVPFKNPWEVPLAQEQGQGSHNNQLCEERGGSDEQVC